MLTRRFIPFLLIATAISIYPQSAFAGEADTGDLLRSNGIVFSQSPTHTGGLGSDTSFTNNSGFSISSQEADQVLFSDTTQVRRISWWGFYGPSFGPHENPPLAETFRVRFYDARPVDGLPGKILLEGSTQDAHRFATGAIVQSANVFDEFTYYIDLSEPLVLNANTPYWLEVVQIGDINSTFRWENGIGVINGHAVLTRAYPKTLFSLVRITRHYVETHG